MRLSSIKIAFLSALAFAQADQPDAKDERIALLETKLALYQRGLFACQDAQIEAQARQQMPKPKPVQGAQPQP